MNNTNVYPSLPILIIDDETHALNSMRMILSTNGMENSVCLQDSRKVLTHLKENPASIILLDIFMPHHSGETLLEKITKVYPEIPVIMITGNNNIETVVSCMKKGAYDYLAKPIKPEHILTVVKRALRFRMLHWDNLLIKEFVEPKDIKKPEEFKEIITGNKRMHCIFNYIEAIAGTSEPVLITGETGTGKELIENVIYTLSNQKGENIKVNISGIDDSLMADALFGHEKGAYTGALTSKEGLVAAANEGTLFLDEIGDLSLTSQLKLLRFLEDREYYPIGSNKAKRSNARVIMATNNDLQALISNGKFRKDLYYRIITHRIHLPPLRERGDDIYILCNYFIKTVCRNLKKNVPAVPKELYTLLKLYDFPGNIREYKSMITDTVSTNTNPVLSTEFIRNRIIEKRKIKQSAEFISQGVYSFFTNQIPTIQEAEEYIINKALALSDNNQRIAAELLGISRQALNHRLRKTRNKKSLGF